VIFSSSHTEEVKALDSRWWKWSDGYSGCGTYLVAVPNMRVSGGRCLMVTWNMVPFSKGKASTRAHGLNQVWRTELMTLDFEKKKKKKKKWSALRLLEIWCQSEYQCPWIERSLDNWINDPWFWKKKKKSGVRLDVSEVRSSFFYWLTQKQQQRGNGHQGSTLET